MQTEQRKRMGAPPKAGRPSRLRRIRLEAGLERKTAAEGIGCAYDTLSIYENSLSKPSKNFKRKALEFYSKTLGRPLTDTDVFGRWG